MDFSNLDPQTMLMLLQLMKIKQEMEEEQSQNQNNENEEDNKRSNNKDLLDVITQTESSIREWCKMDNYIQLNDSFQQEFSKEDFFEKTMNKENLVFIFQDNRGNVFGSYMKTPITQISEMMHYVPNVCPHHFIFSLESNGRLEKPTKWNAIPNQRTGMFYFKNDPTFIDIGNHIGRIVVVVPGMNNTYFKDIQKTYEGINPKIISGVNGMTNYVTLKRVVVLQMKE